jgi:hypothetical protein
MNPVMSLVGSSDEGIEGMFDELLILPTIDTSLQVHLPNTLISEVDGVLNLLDGPELHPHGTFKRAITYLIGKLDSPAIRLQLAQAVLALRQGGRISDPLAVLAIFDLEREYSLFLNASVATSIGAIVKPGRRPPGLPMSFN